MTEKQLSNLRPPTTEEAKERGQIGGVKSGEARREKKLLREAMEIALQTKQSGELNYLQAGIKATIERWIRTGDIAILNGIRDLLGENPKNVVELESNELTGIKVKFVDKSKMNNNKEHDPKIVGDYTPPTNTEE